MNERIELGDITIEVMFKAIKNLHLSVHPPNGRVTVSAPSHMDVDAIRIFTISKLGWIRKQQQKLRAQERETPREYLERESHYVWGKRYLLTIVECNRPPAVSLEHRRMRLQVRPETSQEQRAAIVDAWYRDQLKRALPDLIAKWEPVLGVSVEHFFVQRMKTRWGSCNPATHSIRLNTDLAKKPPDCLEYIVIHEMVHLLEPTHNARFISLMDQFLPNWPYYRQKVNRLPVRHEDWRY